CARRGVGVLSFSAICYGRMLQGDGAPSAADCYRYSLSQPGVTAAISAPRRHRELVENLEVIARPTLEALDLERLRAHGAKVYRGNVLFNRLIREAPDARAKLRALLEEPGES